jgi:hypothetical protein
MTEYTFTKQPAVVLGYDGQPETEVACDADGTYRFGVEDVGKTVLIPAIVRYVISDEEVAELKRVLEMDGNHE